MKTKTLLASIIMVLLLATPTYAALAPRTTIAPTLTFTNTTATCGVTIFDGSSSAKITAVISLKNGNDCIESWERSAVGYFYFNETVSVTRGQTYTLSVDATIDGKTYQTASTSNTCK